jgi:hypothetical protein
MVSKETLLEILPLRPIVVLTADRQNTEDIRELILRKYKEYAGDYDLISHYFDTGNIVDTSRQIFDFLKRNVPYTKESGKYQTVKAPAYILSSNDGSGKFDRVDCKNYASFIAGIIGSIKRRNGGNWDWTFRFASYNENDSEPGHVFVVVKVDGRELWIDPVFTYFNGGTMHEWELDERPSIGGLYAIGAADTGGDVMTANFTVNNNVAWVSFLQMVTHNYFSVKDLLLAFPDVTSGAVCQWCIANGFDYNQLITFLGYAAKN